jgi:hypothetical protein
MQKTEIDWLSEDNFTEKLKAMQAQVAEKNKPAAKNKTDMNPFSRMRSLLQPVLDCTSCRRWWAGVVVGFSTAGSALYGFLPFLITLVIWAIFFKWAEYAYKNGAGGEGLAEAMKGMDLFQSVDTILGAKECDTLYLLLIFLAVLLSLGGNLAFAVLVISFSIYLPIYLPRKKYAILHN